MSMCLECLRVPKSNAPVAIACQAHECSTSSKLPLIAYIDFHKFVLEDASDDNRSHSLAMWSDSDKV